jgi:protein-disulfide isomerase
MDHNDMGWVDARMEALDPPQVWQPDSAAALERFRRMRRQADVARKWRIWAACAAAAACIAAVAIWPRASRPEENRPGLVVPVSFRETGSPNAPILAEIYSDYQCGHCALLLLETVPQLVTDYVATGKVRLLHRDLPLPQHSYARQAARYADAAGSIGRYDVVAGLLFRTQREWSADGDIEARLARVLAPAEMDQVRGAVRDSAKIDAAIDADIAMARRDNVRETPTIVVVANGRRRALAPVPPYPLLKAYLDEQLKTNCRENPNAALC